MFNIRAQSQLEILCVSLYYDIICQHHPNFKWKLSRNVTRPTHHLFCMFRPSSICAFTRCPASKKPWLGPVTVLGGVTGPPSDVWIQVKGSCVARSKDNYLQLFTKTQKPATTRRRASGIKIIPLVIDMSICLSIKMMRWHGDPSVQRDLPVPKGSIPLYQDVRQNHDVGLDATIFRCRPNQFIKWNTGFKSYTKQECATYDWNWNPDCV